MGRSLLSTIQLLAAGASFVNALPQQQFGPAGNLIVPGGTAPETQTLKATANPSLYPTAQRIKIRYGPYTMAGAGSAGDIMAAITHEAGTFNTIAIAMKKPCASNCGIIRMQAGLEYQNGSIANTANDAWLHHVVMFANGQGKKDVTCAGGIGFLGERFFSSGNERTPTPYTDLTKGTYKSAWKLNAGDSFGMQLELMNMSPQQKKVYYTIDYEIVPTIPAGFTQTKALWLDVTNCGASFVPPPANQKKFTLKMNQWTSNINGNMLGTAGHLHDGGDVVNVYQNNKVICTSKATYSKAGEGKHAMSQEQTNSGYGTRKRDGPHNDDMPHIDQMSSCDNLGPIKVGDRIYIDAVYDLNKYMAMGDAGGLAPVMGIAILFVTTAL